MRSAQAADQVADLDDLDRIQPHRRFVENDHPRLTQKRLSDADALPVTLRKIADAPAHHVAGTSLLRHLFDLRRQFCAAQALRFADETQIFQRRLVHVQRRLLWQIADEPLRGVRFLEHIMAADRDTARRRRQTARHDVHRRRFSGAVWSEKTIDLAFFDLKRQIVQRQDLAIFFRQMFHFDHGDTSLTFVRPGSFQTALHPV